MKKLLASVFIALTAAVIPVTAASAAPTHTQAPISAKSGISPNVYTPLSRWQTIDDCINVGEYGRNRGDWKTYACDYQPRYNGDSYPYLLSVIYD
jgi:hypothetical protein